jgi:Double-GTPase 2
MPQNTVEDFINTADPNLPDIICPACGTPMGITQSGSYDMVLTVNAQRELNDILSLYRRFLHGIERELESRNLRGFNVERIDRDYPYRDRAENNLQQGLHSTAYAKRIGEELSRYLDFHDWHKFLQIELPTIETLKELTRNTSGRPTNVDRDKELKNAFKNIIFGFEPYVQIGYTVDLLFDQDNIKKWMRDVQLDVDYERNGNATPSRKIHELVKGVCPVIYEYFVRLVEITKVMQPQDKIGNSSQKDLVDRITRCMYIVALLLGHEDSKADELSKYLLRRGVAINFPKLTVVSPNRLKQLITSRTLTRRQKNLQLSEDFIQQLVEPVSSQSDADWSQTRAIDESLFEEEFMEIMKDDLSKFVRFVCTGPSGSVPPLQFMEQLPGNMNETKLKDLYRGERDQCGWYPKPEETHPVVLIGSPGTGKSTVMMAGLTTFYNNASALGARVVFTSDEDIRANEQYSREYWAGILPKATEEGSRRSIHLTVESVEDPHDQVNFVFTDIPGEVAARGLKGEGSHPVVLDVLQHTETIVFFFDISIEPSIRKVLTQGSSKDIWGSIIKNFSQTSEERQEDKTSQDPETSKANVSQLQLLGKLIQDLRDVRGEGIDQVNFICVIPKADLFVDEDSSDTHFLTKFYRYLCDVDLLIPSLYTSNDTSLQNHRSISSTGSKLLNENSELVQSQIDIATTISDKAVECLKDIGHALGPEGDGVHPADREALQNIIEKGLIRVLEKNFNSVYVLPVSPQGKQYEPSQKQQLETGTLIAPETRKLGHPPNQKLSEYVFILPVILAMKGNEITR